MFYNFIIFLLTISIISCDVQNIKINEFVHAKKTRKHYVNTKECKLPASLKEEIASYRTAVNNIISATTKDNFKGRTYNELASFVDKFGSRFTGTQNLENAIDYMIDKSLQSGLENVHGEEVTVPQWVRGSESASLIEPRQKNIQLLGLGYSVGTPLDGITAEVLVVKSFDELQQKSEQAKDKIVVFNQDFISYGDSVVYRSRGASEASKVGAVASLIRSITPFSLSTPHTGMQTYAQNVTKIPTACITVEDAKFLERLQNENYTIKINLKMDAQMLPPVKSRNTVAEIIGGKNPEKVVVVSGHLDSWDVGDGAMDDGAGVFISWSALAVLKSLNLRPKRTIRAIFWTAEEMGLIGAYKYASAHRNETDNLVFVMESDIGTFNPVGLEYSGGATGACIIAEVAKLLKPINATKVRVSPVVGSDISIWTANGIPGASLDTQNENYFWYHHSNADTIDVENSDALDKHTGLWAAVAYVLADLNEDFPRVS